MAIADDRQRLMPTAEDRSTGQRLDYDEAALITNPSNPKLRGEVLLSTFFTKSFHILYRKINFLKVTLCVIILLCDGL